MNTAGVSKFIVETNAGDLAIICQILGEMNHSCFIFHLIFVFYD